MVWTVKVHFWDGRTKEYQEKGGTGKIVQEKVFKKYGLDWNVVRSVVSIPLVENK